MSQSVAGNTEAPGKNVRVKSGLNKSILDQGWFEFRLQLDYKLAWRGGLLVGAINVLRAGQARFACEVSGAVMTPAAGTHLRYSGAALCRSWAP
jgi:putative transposase